MKLIINKPTELDIKFLKVDAGVRYWEDAEINGKSDDEAEEPAYRSEDEKPSMPCAEWNGRMWRWRPVIDIDSGKIMNWERGVTANVYFKVCDDFEAEITDEQGNVVSEYSDYVPRCMCPKENGYGDYIIMNIDKNGYINGWDGELVEGMLN